MAQLIVRNLEDSVKRRLERRARRHGRSMEEEVRTILREAANADEAPARIGSRIAALFEGIGLDHEIVEFRGSSVEAPDFE